jgi:hypothetical protein
LANLEKEIEKTMLHDDEECGVIVRFNALEPV